MVTRFITAIFILFLCSCTASEVEIKEISGLSYIGNLSQFDSLSLGLLKEISKDNGDSSNDLSDKDDKIIYTRLDMPMNVQDAKNFVECDLEDYSNIKFTSDYILRFYDAPGYSDASEFIAMGIDIDYDTIYTKLILDNNNEVIFDPREITESENNSYDIFNLKGCLSKAYLYDGYIFMIANSYLYQYNIENELLKKLTFADDISICLDSNKEGLNSIIVYRDQINIDRFEDKPTGRMNSKLILDEYGEAKFQIFENASFVNLIKLASDKNINFVCDFLKNHHTSLGEFNPDYVKMAFNDEVRYFGKKVDMIDILKNHKEYTQDYNLEESKVDCNSIKIISYDDFIEIQYDIYYKLKDLKNNKVKSYYLECELMYNVNDRKIYFVNSNSKK